MSTSIHNISQPNTSYTLDNGIIAVQSGASLNLTGSSDVVLLDRGVGNTNIIGGINNVISFDANGGAQSIQAGSSFVREDANGNISYSGTLSGVKNGVGTIGLGNGNLVNIFNVQSSGKTIWAADPAQIATQVTQLDTSYAINGITLEVQRGASLDLTGSSDKVILHSGAGNTNILDGSNNSISFDANGGAQSIQAGSSFVREDANGDIRYSGALSGVRNGVATIGLVNGNFVTISNVQSSGSTIWAVGPVQQQIEVTQPNTTYTINDAVLEVRSGASLNLTGSFDAVILDSGAGNTNIISGSNNYISFDANGGAQSIHAGSSFVREDANGNISYSGTLSGVKKGVATIGLGNGNFVTISNVQSSGSTIWATGPVQQLVSGIAS